MQFLRLRQKYCISSIMFHLAGQMMTAEKVELIFATFIFNFLKSGKLLLASQDYVSFSSLCPVKKIFSRIDSRFYFSSSSSPSPLKQIRPSHIFSKKFAGVPKKIFPSGSIFPKAHTLPRKIDALSSKRAKAEKRKGKLVLEWPSRTNRRTDRRGRCTRPRASCAWTSESHVPAGHLQLLAGGGVYVGQASKGTTSLSASSSTSLSLVLSLCFAFLTCGCATVGVGG